MGVPHPPPMVEKFFHLFLPYQYSIQPLGCSLYSFLEDGPIRWIKKVWRTDMALDPWDWAQSVQITQKFPGSEALVSTGHSKVSTELETAAITARLWAPHAGGSASKQ